MKYQDSMREYMRDVGRVPLLTREEEVALGKRIQQGDDDAKDLLIKANLRLVVKIAHDFKGMGLSLQDLVAEGNMGLIRATEKFDPDKGTKFSSYAAWWIKQAMRRALTEKSRTIRIPIASIVKLAKIRHAKQKLKEELHRIPTGEELAQETQLSERVIRRLQLSEMKTFALQDPLFDGEGGELSDVIADEDAIPPDTALVTREAINQIRQLIKKLDRREQKILTLRFGLDGSRPKTLEEISKSISRTRERVRQIQKRALRKLRVEMMKDELLKEGAHPILL